MVTSLSQLNVNGYKVISFDLFDTLIFRRSIPSSEIQHLSAEYLSGKIKQETGKKTDPDQLIELRQSVTRQLKNSFLESSQEPELLTILTKILLAFGVEVGNASNIADSCVMFELHLERASLKLSADAEEFLNYLYQSDRKLIIISDMYFSRKHILVLLDALGITKYFTEIFISSELGKTKQTGELFYEVLRQLDCQAKDVVHIGDNFYSDMVNARRAGVQSSYYRPSAKLFSSPASNLGVESCLSDLVLSFMGRLMMLAHKESIQRLYFVSRDATAIFDLFNLCIDTCPEAQNLCDGLDVRVLDVNRTTTVFFDLEFGRPVLPQVLSLFLLVHPKGYYLKELFRFLQIGEYPRDLDQIQVSHESMVLDAAEVLIQYAGLTEIIILSVKEHITTTVDYLENNQVIGKPGKVGLVDIGYQGSVPVRLAKYLQREGTDTQRQFTDISLFFICDSGALRKKIKPTYPLINNTFSILSYRKLSTLQCLNYSWLEIFFKDSSRGPLLSYKTADGKLVPNYAIYDEEKSFSPWYSECVAMILSNDFELMPYFRTTIALRSADKFIKKMAFPQKELVNYLQEKTFSRGYLDQKSLPIVDVINYDDCFKPSFWISLIKEDYWLDGSLVWSGKKWVAYLLNVIFKILLALKSLVSMVTSYKDKFFRIFSRWFFIVKALIKKK